MTEEDVRSLVYNVRGKLRRSQNETPEEFQLRLDVDEKKIKLLAMNSQAYDLIFDERVMGNNSPTKRLFQYCESLLALESVRLRKALKIFIHDNPEADYGKFTGGAKVLSDMWGRNRL